MISSIQKVQNEGKIDEIINFNIEAKKTEAEQIIMEFQFNQLKHQVK